MSVELKTRVALDRIASFAMRAKVTVKEKPTDFPKVETEEIHRRRGKLISIGFDGDGFPVDRREIIDPV